MKYCLSKWYLLIILLTWCPIAFASQPYSEADERKSAGIILAAEKTLIRRFDPVVVTGDLLPMMEGFNIDNFRLFAHDGNRFQVIPFQIDERNPDGEFVFSHGKTAGKDSDSGLFDYNDELVFMAKDSGCRVVYEEWAKLSNTGVEILITDPLDITMKGWVYLIYFPENTPPLSGVDYVSFTKEEEGETIQSDFYTMKYKEGATFYSYLSYPETNGGNGENFIDRMKVRVTVKALFNTLKINKTEDDMRDELLGWKDGPVRALRCAQSFFTIFFNLEAPSAKSTTQFYATLTHHPVLVDIPFNLKWLFSRFSISTFDFVVYADFPGLIGGMSYDNRNSDVFQYTGSNPGRDFSKDYKLDNMVWGYITKEGVGAYFAYMMMPELVYGIGEMYIIDDENLADPPEDVPGVIGGGLKISMAELNKDIWSVLRRGSYQMAEDTYFPRPDIKTDEVEEWLNIRGFPLSININKAHGLVATAAPEAYSKKVKEQKKKKSRKKTFSGILTDIRDRQYSLDNINFYFGSAEVTPRTYVAAKKGSGKEADYFLLEFKDISKIEHYISDIEPVTGIKNPMYQKLTMQDGDTYDILGCKPCGFGGELEDGRKIFFWNTQVKSLDFNTR